MTGRARRADAELNRDRIVEVARELLAQSDAGPGAVNLRLIAQRAGVGQGTLYRHFPTREDLITAVYVDELGSLVGAVPELLASCDPPDALRRWLLRVVDYAQVKRGVIAAIETSTWQRLYTAEGHRLDLAIDQLLECGRDAGVLRSDVDATDVVLLLGALSRVPAAEWQRRAPVIVAVIVDGLTSRV